MATKAEERRRIRHARRGEENRGDNIRGKKRTEETEEETWGRGKGGLAVRQHGHTEIR